MASYPCLVSVISDAHVIETGQLPAIHEDPSIAC
jgi:hypothetical protein